jgi:hypothetical protein
VLGSPPVPDRPGPVRTVGERTLSHASRAPDNRSGPSRARRRSPDPPLLWTRRPADRTEHENAL